MGKYDVYHQWLGITPDEQPPSLYRLLGIADFEQDTEVIRNAAERQAMHVRRLARGEFLDVGQELLNEIAEAKLSLLSPATRDSYNSKLRESRGLSDRLLISEVEATYIDIQQPKESWVIGYHQECDFRIDLPTISGIHCQLTHVRGRYYLSDLKSANGTYINKVRIRTTQRITSLDLLTLGRDHRIIVPSNILNGGLDVESSVLFIGRGKGNEIQLDSSTTSLFHARAIYDAQSVVLEDLGSKRGTFVIRDGKKPARVKKCRLRSGDIIRFADYEVKADKLLRLCNKKAE